MTDPAAERGNEIRQLFAFVLELDKLKAIERRVKPLGLERYENSAEHSWQIAILALLLARTFSEPVDVARAVEILLVHDIPEIDHGDQFVYSRDAASTAEGEARAAERIFGLLPAAEGERFLARWREYEARETPEARLAYAADRLMPMLQNLFGGAQSWRENRVPRERVRELAEGAFAASCPDVWREIEPLIDEVYAREDLARRDA